VLDYLILTTTFNRGGMLLQIVNALKAEAERKGLNVVHIILNDGSTRFAGEYEIISKSVSPNYRVDYWKSPQNKGKAGYWETVNHLWKMAKGYKFTWAVMMPDDCLPCKDFLERVTAQIKACQAQSHRKAVVAMNICPTQLASWGSSRFIDGAFIADRRLFQGLAWALTPIGFKGREAEFRGSGIGAQMTRRMLKHQAFQVAPCQDIAFLAPFDTPSVMFRRDRRRKRWWRRNYIDGY